ncbi:MAG: hypothetical protein JNL45_12425 [Hyphomicrobium sp.]|nr:hypothetical protein [Hyphomicrobium sp.]
MEAYMFRQDYYTMTEAEEIDRVPMQFDPLGKWQLETGGGAKVPIEWFKAWPTIAIVAPSDKPLTPWLAAGSYCVNQDVKDIIEELAPDVHQFIPLSVEAGPADGRRIHQYYSLHIANRADEVVVEKSNVVWEVNKYSANKVWRKNKAMALPLASIKGKHLWRNRPCMMYCMSGELHDRLQERNLLGGLELEKQIVVE